MKTRQKIQLLPAELQNQIAAGEVLERPASALKELVENALDAGATRIQIQLRDGGQSFLEVTDNGAGIPPEEIPIALTRHATSKITNMADLQQIASFGFRGEALPSIASVSRFSLASALIDGEGIRHVVQHGKVQEGTPVAMTRGTAIQVSDLFANVPARLKFLKQPATEFRKCSETLTRMALANLHVEFLYQQAEREVYHFLPGQTLRERLRAIWPHPIVDACIEVSSSMQGMAVHGLTGSPQTAQSRADRIYFYVNGRPVQDKIMLSAVREAYRGQILGKEYPQAILFLTLPPEDVDINVHPAKSEVRFAEEGEVFRLLRRGVVEALTHASTKQTSPEPEKNTTSNSIALQQKPANQQEPHFIISSNIHPLPHTETQKFTHTKLAEALYPETKAEQDLRPEQPSSKSTQAATKQQLAENTQPYATLHPAPTPQRAQSSPEFRYLGQIAKTYLVLETPNGLTLLDQHAVHERILFDTIRKECTQQNRQPLLMPFELSLHVAEAEELQTLWTELIHLGFSLELPSPQRLLVKAIPPLLAPAKAKEFLTDILAAKARTMEDFWAIMACKGAIKAGDHLTEDEALTLLESWQNLPDREHCPHGRPTAVSWNIPDLEKLFKRRP